MKQAMKQEHKEQVAVIDEKEARVEEQMRQHKEMEVRIYIHKNLYP